MKATGIVRRIDDLGRVVIPKEIRRTMRIRDGDPLEIYTDHEGGVIFKKYSPMGEFSVFASQLCDTINKTTGCSCAVCDRDSVIAAAGSARKSVIDKRVSPDIERIMEARVICRLGESDKAVPLCEGQHDARVVIAAPILSEGDVSGCMTVLAGGDSDAGEPEYKLAQTAAAFLAKQIES